MLEVLQNDVDGARREASFGRSSEVADPTIGEAYASAPVRADEFVHDLTHLNA